MLTVAEAAERLHISISLCYRLIEERQLSCVRMGQKGRRGCIRIRLADLEEYLRRCQSVAE